jgi:hypothetical protein
MEIDLVCNGSHNKFEDGACAMEWVAHLAGEEHTDRPKCACPVITDVVIELNDCIKDDDERTRLMSKLIPKLLNTRDTREVEFSRLWILRDFAVRRVMPWLDSVDSEFSKELRGMQEIEDAIDSQKAKARIDTLLSARFINVSYPMEVEWALDQLDAILEDPFADSVIDLLRTIDEYSLVDMDRFHAEYVEMIERMLDVLDQY